MAKFAVRVTRGRRVNTRIIEETGNRYVFFNEDNKPTWVRCDTDAQGQAIDKKYFLSNDLFEVVEGWPLTVREEAAIAALPKSLPEMITETFSGKKDEKKMDKKGGK